MLYLFQNPDNTASIVYEPSTLTDKQKKEALIIENLPNIDEGQVSKCPILKVDKENNKVWYEYENTPQMPEEIPNDKLEQLEKENLELKLALAEHTEKNLQEVTELKLALAEITENNLK